MGLLSFLQSLRKRSNGNKDPRMHEINSRLDDMVEYLSIQGVHMFKQRDALKAVEQAKIELMSYSEFDIPTIVEASKEAGFYVAKDNFTIDNAVNRAVRYAKDKYNREAAEEARRAAAQERARAAMANDEPGKGPAVDAVQTRKNNYTMDIKNEMDYMKKQAMELELVTNIGNQYTRKFEDGSVTKPYPPSLKDL